MLPQPRFICAVAVGLILGSSVAPLYAQKPVKPFKSPLKNFTVVVPEFPVSTEVQKHNDKAGGTVSFLGAAGHALRIDYTRLPADSTPSADSTKLRASQHKALEDLLSENPSNLVSERKYAFDNLPMLLAVVSFPAGSHIQDAASGKRLDSVRGILIFARGGFLYMLHAELAANVVSRPGEAPPSVKELNRRAEAATRDFYRTITFQ